MTTIHDFFSPTVLQTIVSASNPGGGYFSTASWGDTIQWWKDNYPNKNSFIAAATGNVPVFPWWYGHSSAPDSQYGLLKLSDSLPMPTFDYGSPPCTPGSIPSGVVFTGTSIDFCGVKLIYSYEFASNKGAGIAYNSWSDPCTPGNYLKGWWQDGPDTIPSRPILTGNENQFLGYSPTFLIDFKVSMNPNLIQWTLPLSDIIQLESCKDINSLANYIYGGPSPVIMDPVFGMDYPPVNPGSTDILIPQHTIPPLKRRIPFQNYTHSIPRMIKK